MATLVVSWASTCLVIVHGIQYTNPVLLIQLLISNIIWFDGHLSKQQTRSTSYKSYCIYLNIISYAERNLVYILKTIFKCKRITKCRHHLLCNKRQKCTLKWSIVQMEVFQISFLPRHIRNINQIESFIQDIFKYEPSFRVKLLFEVSDLRVVWSVINLLFNQVRNHI